MDTVVGAAIGAIAVLASNWLQARRERQREQQAVAERAGEAARVRAQDAAVLCDRLFTTLRTLLPPYLQAQRRPTASDDVEREAGNRVRSALDEIDHAMVDLPGPVQARVSAAVDYLRSADDLAEYGHHYHSSWSIVHNTCRDIHLVLTAFLRNESIPEPSEWVVEYEAAYSAFEGEREWEFAQEIGEDQNARALWLGKHPHVADELRRRGFTLP